MTISLKQALHSSLMQLSSSDWVGCHQSNQFSIIHRTPPCTRRQPNEQGTRARGAPGPPTLAPPQEPSAKAPHSLVFVPPKCSAKGGPPESLWMWPRTLAGDISAQGKCKTREREKEMFQISEQLCLWVRLVSAQKLKLYQCEQEVANFSVKGQIIIF